MTWTTEPTADGFYWLRRKGMHDTVVRVSDYASGLVQYGAMVAYVGNDRTYSLCDVLKTWRGKGRWLRIEQPKD